jgi:uncharacterized integral membrane protein (TIGR00698 family)
MVRGGQYNRSVHWQQAQGIMERPTSNEPESNNPYRNPELMRSLASFEGVPDRRPGEGAALRSFREASWQQRSHMLFDWLGRVAPGAALAVGLALAAEAMARWIGAGLLGFERSPVSPILLSIGAGLLIRNTIGLPEVYLPGLRVCLKRILRIGVALLGIRLSLTAAAQLGLIGLPIIVGCIAAALFLVIRISRAMGLSSRLGGLIAVGTGICGVSAIVATGPVIDAEDDEISYSIATITLFGMAALFFYPFLAYWVFAGDPQQAGLFLGTAIHDTAQATGAGLMYQSQFEAPAALDAAIVTKLVRNVCMVGVLPLMAVLYHRRAGLGRAAGSMRWHQIMPLFVLGFLAMIAVRSAGDALSGSAGFLSAAGWESLVGTTERAAQWCLLLAMAAVGLGTSLGRLKTLGLKPLVVGLVAAGLVGGISIGLITLLH